MNDTIILCFRDLVTEPGGTINLHQELINQYGYCWWGWWKKPIEDVPVEVFLQIIAPKKGLDKPSILLYHCGDYELFNATIENIKVAPSEGGMSSPEIDKTPEYYVHLKCAAWFKLNKIEKINNSEEEIKKMIYVSFPSWPKDASHDEFREKNIESFEQMDEMKVTLWHIRTTMQGS